MIIKRLSLLTLLITPSLFAALVQTAHDRKRSRKATSAQKRNAYQNELLAAADKKIQTLLSFSEKCRTLTKEQESAIAALQEKIKEEHKKLNTKSDKGLTTYNTIRARISRYRKKIQQIKASDEISVPKLYEKLLSSEQKKEIEALNATIVEQSVLLTQTKNAMARNTIYARISRCRKKIKIIQAQAVLASDEDIHPAKRVRISPPTVFPLNEEDITVALHTFAQLPDVFE